MLRQIHRMSEIIRKTPRYPHTYIASSYCTYHCCNMQKMYIYLSPFSAVVCLAWVSQPLSLRTALHVLPAFQVRVLICTGDSGSNPERALRRFVACKRLKRKTVRIVNAVMALRNLSLDKTFFNCLVRRSFATECCCMKLETLSFSRKWFMQYQHTYVCLLEFGFTDLNQSCQWDLV
jgi:hypothetical protein